MKKGLLAYLTPLFGLGLASIAAVISVLGMSKLFAGHATIVMVVMAIIEGGKVLGTSLLHYSWKKTGYGIIRWILLTMVISAMVITSWGIYGFFTDAYQKTAGELSIQETEVQLIENKKSVINQSVENLENQIEFKNKQSAKLLEVRTQQEERLETYSKQEGWAAYSNSKRTQKQIDEANDNLMKIQDEINNMYSEINNLNDSIGKLDISILDKKASSSASAELGPLIYIARVFNTDMDSIINYVMLLMMYVFDPFAIILIIYTNRMWGVNKEEKIETPIKKLEKEVIPIEIVEEPKKEREILIKPESKTWEKVKELRKKGKLPTPTEEDIENEPTALANSRYRLEDDIDYSLIEEDNPEDNFRLPTKEEPKVEEPKEEPKVEIENKGEQLNNYLKTFKKIVRNKRKGGGDSNTIIRLGD
jgi:hypothetical protein